MKIIKDRIYINRGNTLAIEFNILKDSEQYTFLTTDKITFSIYNEGELTQEPVISTTISGNGTTSVNIELTQEEMEIGNAEDVNVIFWYQIELNGDVIIGYDEVGPKELILNPRGDV